ncbi:MAG: hypothetical protein ACOC9Y_06675, partial [Chloroflexota bacterium]
MADSTSDTSHRLAGREREAGRMSDASTRLTCQWCSVVLPEGETVCPTCGSSGVPDDEMVVPGSEVLVDTEPAPEIEPQSPEEIEAALEEEPANLYRNSAAEAPEPAVVLLAVGAA